MNDSVVVLLGHGSRDSAGAMEFLALASAVQTALPTLRVEAGVLEFAGPVARSIPDAIARSVAAGARRVLALPVLLHFGGHATADMPDQIASAQARHLDAEIRLAQPLSGHPGLLDIVHDRCAAARLIEPGTTVLLVGRGSTSPRANADLYATARLFQERGPFDDVEVCFVSLTPPCVSAGLRRCVALGARRVLVMPYFVNTGRLVRRIRAQAMAAAGFYPRVQVAVTDHLGPDPRLVAALLDRARDAWPEIVQHTLSFGGESSPNTPAGRACYKPLVRTPP